MESVRSREGLHESWMRLVCGTVIQSRVVGRWRFGRAE
jgi:hypothetical protein